MLGSPCCTTKPRTTENISMARDGSVLSSSGKHGKIYRDHLDLVLLLSSSRGLWVVFFPLSFQFSLGDSPTNVV